ncbi:MAG: hypothetical protein DRQ60_06680 [Gammaproteobacteria bacterium]|nr:MAG: hypothetical protein DRQ60_06680 [Gammaproteobacteria bacterium]
MTSVWGVVSMLVKAIIVAQLAWPAPNFDLPWLHFGRLRPLHINAAIFAFGGCALLPTAAQVVRQAGSFRSSASTEESVKRGSRIFRNVVKRLEHR